VFIEAQRRERLAAEHAAGGTQVGYFLHRRLGERPCAACLAGLQRERAAAARAREAQRRPQRTRAAAVASGADEGAPGPHGGVQRLAIAS
jgi:hypothetical protein